MGCWHTMSLLVHLHDTKLGYCIDSRKVVSCLAPTSRSSLIPHMRDRNFPLVRSKFLACIKSRDGIYEPFSDCNTRNINHSPMAWHTRRTCTWIDLGSRRPFNSQANLRRCCGLDFIRRNARVCTQEKLCAGSKSSSFWDTLTFEFASRSWGGVACHKTNGNRLYDSRKSMLTMPQHITYLFGKDLSMAYYHCSSFSLR